jgi:uncharacterized protein YabN with tetrapyrrole methylase and pyrophosphatase domain
MKSKPKRQRGIDQVLDIMARLRAPGGCPWDREQDHRSLRRHAVEEVYELIDAIESGEDEALVDELGDLLMQIVFHCQLGRERKAFNFDRVCRQLAQKLIRRHPHVFGDARAKTPAAVWVQWDQIKRTEQEGRKKARRSALDGIPRHLPSLLRTEKLVKKARRSGLMPAQKAAPLRGGSSAVGKMLFELVAWSQTRGWSAEDLLRRETSRREERLRRREKAVLKRR